MSSANATTVGLSRRRGVAKRLAFKRDDVRSVISIRSGWAAGGPGFAAPMSLPVARSQRKSASHPPGEKFS
jgi:hypothetical protein